jgi:DNA-binding beta-propeller fold protein YncE
MFRLESGMKTALVITTALAALSFAESASAWQDANEIIATIPPVAGSVADVFVYVDSLRGKVYTGGEVINANTDTVIKTFPGYSVVAADPIHAKVYARTPGPTLSVIDENTDTVTGAIGTHVDPAHAFVDPLHEKLILINNAAPPNVGVTDLRTGKVLNTFPLLPVTGQPRAVAVDVVRETIYVFIQGDSSPFTAAPYSILALDERTGETKATIATPVISQWLSVDQEKGLLYAAGTGYSVDNVMDAPGTAIVIDMRTNKILETVVTAPANPPGDEQTITEEVVPDPANNIVYAAHFSNSTVVAFDERTGKVTATITMPAKMFGLGIDPSRRKVYAEAPLTGTIYVISAPGWGKKTFAAQQ